MVHDVTETYAVYGMERILESTASGSELSTILSTIRKSTEVQILRQQDLITVFFFSFFSFFFLVIKVSMLLDIIKKFLNDFLTNHRPLKNPIS